jgi:hypothetical protein
MTEVADSNVFSIGRFRTLKPVKLTGAINFPEQSWPDVQTKAYPMVSLLADSELATHS